MGLDAIAKALGRVAKAVEGLDALEKVDVLTLACRNAEREVPVMTLAVPSGDNQAPPP